MPKKIPISQAKGFAVANDLKQVIIVGWDGERSHVLTYGDTEIACDQAAQGGNVIKKALGWPRDWDAEPSRVTALKERVAQLEAQNRSVTDAYEGLDAGYNDLMARYNELKDTDRQLQQVMFENRRLQRELDEERQCKPKTSTVPELPPLAKVPELFVVEMTEMDFGQRPEGYCAFLSWDEAKRWVFAQPKGSREAYVKYDIIGKRPVHWQRFQRLIALEFGDEKRITYANTLTEFLSAEEGS